MLVRSAALALGSRALAARPLCAKAQPVPAAPFPQLLRVALPGALEAWEAAGFSRSDDPEDLALSIGGVDVGIHCQGAPTWGWRDGPASRAEFHVDDWVPAWDGLAADGWTELSVGAIGGVSGIATSIDDLSAAEHGALVEERAGTAVEHANGATGLYSIAILTPDLQATIGAFEAAGLSMRRLRKPDDAASPLSKGLSMAFFKLSVPPAEAGVIVELIAPAEGAEAGAPTIPGFPPFGDAPAIAGIVVSVPSLAPVAALLGPMLGTERRAVQGKGRRIASVRRDAEGLEALPPLAFITPPAAGK